MYDQRVQVKAHKAELTVKKKSIAAGSTQVKVLKQKRQADDEVESFKHFLTVESAAAPIMLQAVKEGNAKAAEIAELAGVKRKAGSTGSMPPAQKQCVDIPGANSAPASIPATQPSSITPAPLSLSMPANDYSTLPLRPVLASDLFRLPAPLASNLPPPPTGNVLLPDPVDNVRRLPDPVDNVLCVADSSGTSSFATESSETVADIAEPLSEENNNIINPFARAAEENNNIINPPASPSLVSGFISHPLTWAAVDVARNYMNAQNNQSNANAIAVVGQAVGDVVNSVTDLAQTPAAQMSTAGYILGSAASAVRAVADVFRPSSQRR